MGQNRRKMGRLRRKRERERQIDRETKRDLSLISKRERHKWEQRDIDRETSREPGR